MAALAPIQVKGQASPYPVVVTEALANQYDLLAAHIKARQLLLVTSQNLEAVASPIHQALQASGQFEKLSLLTIADGDAHKSLETANLIWDALIQQGYLRDCLIIAIGGGVVGDMVGFVAACYMRGVDWLNIPTTLLAQVDAAIGGKTAVNHPLGKNLIGAFHAPIAVLTDIKMLDTLPEEEYLAGLAEVIKYGIALDQSFLDWLDQSKDLILNRESAILLTMVHRCAQIKANVVSDDFKEHGKRALLNFGHTAGHAIESCMQYKIKHGFAVSMGMAVALRYSLTEGLTQIAYEKAMAVIQNFGLPTDIPSHLKAEELLASMARDKKNLSGAPLRMIIIPQLGQSECVSHVSPEKVIEALRFCGAG